MRPVFFFVAIAITALIGFSACVRTAPVSIEGKWTFQAAIGHYAVPTGGPNRRDTTRYAAPDFFEFKSDGMLNITVAGVSHNGKWAMTNNKLIMSNTGYVDYPAGFDVSVLTSNNLELFYTESQPYFLEQKLVFVR